MKIAVTASGGELSSAVDPRFGRCQYFIIYDTDAKAVVEVMDNAAAQAAGGAGIQAGQLIVNKDVKAVLTGNVGPNAAGVLSGGGVAVYTGMSGTVQEAVDKFMAGGLSASSGPTVGMHAGMGGAAPPPQGGPAAPPPAAPAGPGGGAGMGPGTGMGRGGGGGRGMGMGGGGGRGMGGGGRGMGMGRGGGRGRGFGAGPPAECVCPSCGERVAHAPGMPCRSMQCPKCNCVMVRGD
jgi:predicted Fe-Mo cluster-binding NifX family protein